MTDSFAGVILAAGLSRRMGHNKLLLSVDGVPMVRRVAEVALAGGLDPVVVVVGPAASSVRDALSGLRVIFAQNERPESGLSSSLRVGIAALGEDGAKKDQKVAGVVVLLGDMPWVEAAHVRRLVEAFDPGAGRVICVPIHEGQRGNPVLWGAVFFDEMMTLTGDVGARSLLARHAEEVHEVPVEGEGVLRDVDIAEALAPTTRAHR